MTLTAPSAGTVTLGASVTFRFAHTSGTCNDADLCGGSPLGACSDTAGYAHVVANEPSDTYCITVAMMVNFPVNGPGTRFLSPRKEPRRGRHGASRERDLPGWGKESGT